jgi:hypothetical protein
MGAVALRVFIYSVLPLIVAVVHLGLDKGSPSRERKLEIFLLYLFGVGVAGSGIGGSSYLRWGNAGHAGEADAVI